MKALFPLALIVCAMLLYFSLDPVERDRRSTAAHYAQQQSQIALERERLALDLQRNAAERAEWRAANLSPVWLVAGGLLIVLGVVTCGLVVGATFDAYRQRRTPLVRADDRGLYPLARPALVEGSYDQVIHLVAQLNQQVRALAAVHTPGQTPQALTYAPHHARHDTPALLPNAGLVEDAADQPLPGVTDLADLHYTPSADRLLLALGPGGASIIVGAKALCHVALLGATGGGKSNLMRLLLPQLQALGARVVLADPHYTDFDQESGDDWRAIRRRLHMAPAIYPQEIDELLSWLVAELDQRMELRRQQQPVGKPLFLALDELPIIVDQVPGTTERLGRLLREGRKVGLLCVGASQDFLVKTLGGTSAARDAYRTAFYVGGDLVSARALLDLRQADIDEGALGNGLAYLRSAANRPAQIVRIPLASNRAIAGLLGMEAPTMERRAPSATPSAAPSVITIDAPAEVIREATSEGTAEATEHVSLPSHSDATDPRAERVRQMVLQGCLPSEIVAAIWGVTSGRSYTRAAKELAEIMARLVQR